MILRKADADLLAKTPALAAYIGRISAVQKSFRRYVVEDDEAPRYGTMRRAKAVITIDADGNVACSVKEFAPTEEEAKAIKVEVAKADWPNSIPARNTGKLKKLVKGELYEFRNAGGMIPFVQERVENDDGSKTYLPWSYWSDGAWRCMEPDGLLPLFALDTLKDAPRVFIHEGAKAARAAQQIAGDHPWGAALKLGVHLGWPGGALNPHRVDWSPIAKLSRDVRVILVCDNDRPGESAAPQIAKRLGRHMQMIRFGSAFPEKFDLADPFPDSLYAQRRGRLSYIGPGLEDCLRPATWAVKTLPPSGKRGKPATVIRPEWAAEWVFSIKPRTFIHTANWSQRYSPDEFNALIAPFADGFDVAKKLLVELASQAHGLAYIPGEKSGPVALGGQTLVNTYRASDIEPCEADAGPWLEFMEHFVPDEGDRIELMRWCATLIARPEVRMLYSVLLISETQGVGKGTLGEKILAPLVGTHNCSFPSSQEICDSSFNSWLAFKRLAVVHELYDGHSTKAYNRLKSIITDKSITLNEKYEKAVKIDNWIHIFACSNSLRALKIARDDRRWFIPEVTDEKRGFEYWKKLNTWLDEGGLEVIRWWADDWLSQNEPVAQGAEAPSSAAKMRAVVAAMSHGEKLIHDLGFNMVKFAPGAVLRLDELRVWLTSQKSADPQYGNDGTFKLETPETISRVLRGLELKTSKKQFKVGGARFRVVALSKIDEQARWADLEGRYMTPEAIDNLDDETADARDAAAILAVAEANRNPVPWVVVQGLSTQCRTEIT